MWNIVLLEYRLYPLNALIQNQLLHYVAQLATGILLQRLRQQRVIIGVPTLQII